jgi:hypothetical protein
LFVIMPFVTRRLSGYNLPPFYRYASHLTSEAKSAQTQPHHAWVAIGLIAEWREYP